MIKTEGKIDPTQFLPNKKGCSFESNSRCPKCGTVTVSLRIGFLKVYTCGNCNYSETH